MQVFIIGSPYETAMVLSERHLNNQINEAGIILKALNGKKAWSKHPAVLQYKGHKKYLEFYLESLKYYQQGERFGSAMYSRFAIILAPKWHCLEYYNQMKRRLYTKNPEHYKQWEYLGTSLENWYWSQEENRFIKYINGKRV